MFRFIAIVTILVPLFAILFGIIENARYINLPKPKYLGPIQDRIPLKTNEFGRYMKPISIVDYSWVSSSKLFNFLSLKHWSFKSISTSRYFIVAAIANFNYMANGIVYVIDRTNREKQFYQYASKSFLAQAIKEQAKSSIDGCTHFNQSSLEYIRLCYNTNEKVYEVDANVPMHDGIQISFGFKIEYSNEKDQSMVLIYPVEETRPAYTHKIATLPARGKIKINNNKEEEFLDGLSSIDWTLAYSERLTRWKWISLSVVGTNSSNNEPVTIGINLSDRVYNDNNGISMENAIWIGGKVHAVNQIVYELPEEQYITTQLWQIYSTGDINSKTPKIRLSFQPWGSQEEHINVFLVAGDFVQAFGVYNGTIELFDHTYVIENGFGVAENHYAKW
ncbi:unnamed protein product [Rotaria sordida]|uniref:Uncharacterized protein n=1 Tax=Rotaria sordida TaxID=392033 RepID=A0A814PIP0_9BILA|nr:unnamed protein product [Rotaria sordida]CAF1105893.1 unnamed protein product [Rotaria sordida]CAF1110208.1 unnamed protein product [Rotaria sordida]